MDKQFWRERWRRNEIGFHQESVHPALEAHWRSVSRSGAGPVLVPLCGKSLDMSWLAGQGFPVVGVELEPSAAQAFFDAAGLAPATDDSGPLQSFSAGGVTIFAGDFFDFERAGEFGLVYDRAALIALPREMRPAYLEHLASLLAPDARGLLITLEYAQAEMQGPPFSVMPDELDDSPAFDFECLARNNVIEGHPRFADKGLTWLNETVYALQRR